MVFFPLSVLALAAGVYLLMKAKREYLGGAFEILAWLVIVLSLVAIGFGGFRAISHSGKSQKQKHCNIEKKVIIDDKASACPHHHSINRGGYPEGFSANGCQVEGDSVVMDAASCASIMGKNACDGMIKERGRCIMSKDECTKACANAGKGCCIKDKPNATCPNTNNKSCCKKEI